jgi:hypothetical protein
MKTEIAERAFGLELNITPETLEETSLLFRFANNVKAEKPDVFLSFSSAKPWCSVVLKKLHPNKCINTVKRK